MEEIVKYEGTTAVRRAKLVNSFNDGYRGYRRTYRSCTESASLAIARFTEEGAEIAAVLAKPQQYVNRTPLPIEQSPPQAQDGKPPPGQEGRSQMRRNRIRPQSKRPKRPPQSRRNPARRKRGGQQQPQPSPATESGGW